MNFSKATIYTGFSNNSTFFKLTLTNIIPVFSELKQAKTYYLQGFMAISNNFPQFQND